MARKNKMSALLQGFNDGYETVGRVAKDMDLAAIQNAKEEKQTGYSAEDGAALEAAANAKDENGNPYYTVGTDENGKYTVTPVNAPAPADGTPAMPERFASTAPVTVAQKERTNFLGKTFDEAPTEKQKDSARLTAMAGVYSKHGDPMMGMQLRQQSAQADQMDRQGVLTEQQIKAGERTAARDVKADANTAAMEAIDADVADWTTKRLVNPDGTPRAMTPEDHLESSQFRTAKLIAAGKLTEANALAKDNMQMAKTLIETQTVQRDADLAKVYAAVAGGDLSTAGAFYDKYVPDGGKVKAVTQDPKTGAITIERELMDGKKVAPMVLKKGTPELLAALQSFKDPNALYNFSQAEFHRLLQEKADKRGDAQLGIAQAGAKRAEQEFEAGAPERKLKSTMASLQLSLGETDDPAKRAVIQDKLNAIQMGTGADKNAPSEVKLANAMLKAGMAPDMRSALEMAVTKKSQSPEDMHKEFVASGLKNMESGESAVAKADAVMSSMGYTKKGNRWSMGEGSGAAVPKVTTKEEFAKLPSGAIYTGEGGQKYRKP